MRLATQEIRQTVDKWAPGTEKLLYRKESVTQAKRQSQDVRKSLPATYPTEGLCLKNVDLKKTTYQENKQHNQVMGYRL